MVALPEPVSPTVEAIYAAYEADQDGGHRPHLGASGIGKKCSRDIWMDWRWVSRVRFPGRVLRLFDTGNHAEARFVADLRRIGVTVHDVDPATGEQIVVRDTETGHFGGSMDGVAVGFLEAPKAWHVCEFKTHSAKSFADLKKNGVMVSKPQHYAQMQSYMHLEGIDRAFYLAVNKDTDELHGERIRYDAAFGARMVAKAAAIVRSKQPPPRITEDPSWFECRFCDHHPVCHMGKLPEHNCRTCLHSTPTDGGEWVCERKGKHISTEEQRQGCYEHLIIPGMIHGEQIDSAQDGTWVEYRMKDGTTWRDGIPF